MIGDASLFNLLFPVLIVVAVGSRGLRVDEDYMASWANWFNLEHTPESRPTVRRYLQWSRRCRTAGGIAGFLAPVFYLELFNPGREPDDIGGWTVTMMFVGYLLGALIAEVVLDPPGQRPRDATAVLVRLNDYLPTYAKVLQRGLAIASILLAGLYALAKSDARISGLPDVEQVAAFGLAAACISAVTEAVQRRIIARPRPVVTEVSAAVDDAMRRSSVLVIAGGGIALLLNIAGSLFMLSAVSVAGHGPPVWLAFVSFGLVFLVSIRFWLHFGKPSGFGTRLRQSPGVTT